MRAPTAREIENHTGMSKNDINEMAKEMDLALSKSRGKSQKHMHD